MKDKCLNPHCTNESRTRGLCHACYNSALNSIKYGKNTENDLIAQGKILPAFKARKSWWFRSSDQS